MKILLLVLFIILCPAAHAAKYEIDQSHTSVEFKVSHLGISNVRGNFADVKGSFDFDPTAIEQSSAYAEIGVASVDTKNAKRDDHLRNTDFFDQPKFPTMTFKSKKVQKISDTDYKIIGDLTIRGITKEVILDVEKGGLVKDPWGNERAAFSATTSIKRKDFGIVWSKTMDNGSLVVGEEVKIALEVEGIKQK